MADPNGGGKQRRPTAARGVQQGHSRGVQAQRRPGQSDTLAPHVEREQARAPTGASETPVLDAASQEVHGEALNARGADPEQASQWGAPVTGEEEVGDSTPAAGDGPVAEAPPASTDGSLAVTVEPPEAGSTAAPSSDAPALEGPQTVDAQLGELPTPSVDTTEPASDYDDVDAMLNSLCEEDPATWTERMQASVPPTAWTFLAGAGNAAERLIPVYGAYDAVRDSYNRWGQMAAVAPNVWEDPASGVILTLAALGQGANAAAGLLRHLAWLDSIAQWFTAAGGVMSAPETAGVGAAAAAAGEVVAVTVGEFLNVAAIFADGISLVLNFATAGTAAVAAGLAQDEEKRARYMALLDMSNENWLDNIVNLAATAVAFCTGNFVPADVLRPVVGAGLRFGALETVNTVHDDTTYVDQIAQDECLDMVPGNEVPLLPDNLIDEAQLLWEAIAGTSVVQHDFAGTGYEPTDHSPQLHDHVHGLAGSLTPTLHDLGAKAQSVSEYDASLQSAQLAMADGRELVRSQQQAGYDAAELAEQSLVVLSTDDAAAAAVEELQGHFDELRGALPAVMGMQEPKVDGALGGAMSWLVGGLLDGLGDLTDGVGQANSQAAGVLADTDGIDDVVDQMAQLEAGRDARISEATAAAEGSRTHAADAERTAAYLESQEAEIETERSRVSEIEATQRQQYLDLLAVQADLDDEADHQATANDAWRDRNADERAADG